MKTSDILLIALICANVCLATMAFALYVRDAEPSAVAANSMRYGDYLMVTGKVSNTREAILIIDVVARRANIYVPKAGARAGGQEFELLDSRNLAQDFGTRP